MNDQPIASFELLAEAGKLPEKVIELDEGVHVKVRALSGSERFQFSQLDQEDRWGVVLHLARIGLVEPSLADEDDLDRLQPEWIKEIAEAVMNLSGIDEESADEAEKKPETPSRNSGTTSPAISAAQ